MRRRAVASCLVLCVVRATNIRARYAFYVHYSILLNGINNLSWFFGHSTEWTVYRTGARAACTWRAVSSEPNGPPLVLMESVQRPRVRLGGTAQIAARDSDGELFAVMCIVRVMIGTMQCGQHQFIMGRSPGSVCSMKVEWPGCGTIWWGRDWACYPLN